MTKAIAIVALTLASFGTSAAAATCAKREHVVAQLENRFNETLVANAVSRSNKVLEVYGSREKDTWTMLVYLPEQDLSCLAASGSGLDTAIASLGSQ